MLKKYRRFAGLFLIFLAAALLFAWEARGRELVLMQDVCVLKQEVAEGETLTTDLLKTVSVPRNALVQGAILPAEAGRVAGKVSTGGIPAGAQMSDRLMMDSTDLRKADVSCFVIQKDWIFMRSSTLRKGDRVEILTADGQRSFGTFTAAFVKDETETEVRNAEGGGLSFSGGSREDRSEATAAIHHIEIETNLSSYMDIKTYAQGEEEPALLLVRREY